MKIQCVPLRFTVLLLFFLFSSTTVFSQNQAEEAIKQLSSENVTGYLQPFLNGFGANLNSGFSGSASIENRLSVRIDAIGMATIIGDPEKVYEAIPPEPFPQEPVETATIFGGQGATVQGPQGTTYQMQHGQIELDYLPFVVPQLTIGNLFNTQFVVRFFTYSADSNIPDIDLTGLGIRHSFGQYFSVLPIDIAAGAYYQTFKIGDIIEAETLAFDTILSKRLGPLTLYGGMQYEYATMNVQYTFSGLTEDGSEQEVDLDFSSDNNLRALAGLNLSLGFLHLKSDFSIGNVSVFTVGAGIGF
jgi:hypothetical protein